MISTAVERNFRSVNVTIQKMEEQTLVNDTPENN